MEDDRVDETEPWSSRDRRRFWIAMAATLLLACLTLYGLWCAFFYGFTLNPDRLGG